MKAPGKPTELEVMEHNLTHLPFRSWCKICVQSKSKLNPSRILKSRQQVLQMDYSFIGETWRATNHLFERCGCHEWLGTFSCCSLQRSFSVCAGRTAALCLENWKDFRYLASGSRTISEATGPDCDWPGWRTFLPKFTNRMETR